MAAPSLAGPNALTMGLAYGSVKVDPFDDAAAATFVRQDFATNSALPGGTSYTISGTPGTTAVTSGALAFTAGSGASYWVRHAGVYPAGPDYYVRAKVAAWSSGNNPFVGVLYDPPSGSALGAASNYRAGVVITGATGQANLVVTFNGTSQTLMSANPATLSPGDEVCLQVSWPEMWGWARASGATAWTCLGYVANITAINLAATNQNQAWQASLGGSLSASGSVSFSSWQCGYGGGYGTRDYKFFVNTDGSPFVRSNKYWVLATISSGSVFAANHAAVCSLDPTTGAFAPVSYLFYTPSGVSNVTTPMYGGHVLYDSSTDTYTILTNGWGYETQVTGVNEWTATITGSGLFTNLVNVLTATKLVLHTDSGLGTVIAKSVYDGCARFDSASGLWWMAAPETNTQTGWTTYFPTLYKGTSLATLYRVSQDTATKGEGANLAQVGGNWYALFSRDPGVFASYDVATWTKTTLTNWEHFGAVSPATGSHAALVPVNEGGSTRYYVIGFDGTTTAGAGATLGQLFILKSTTAPTGNEWPSANSIALAAPAAANPNSFLPAHLRTPHGRSRVGPGVKSR